MSARMSCGLLATAALALLSASLWLPFDFGRAQEARSPPAKASGFNARPVPVQTAASAPKAKKKKRKPAVPASDQISERFVPAQAKLPATDARKP